MRNDCNPLIINCTTRLKIFPVDQLFFHILYYIGNSRVFKYFFVNKLYFLYCVK